MKKKESFSGLMKWNYCVLGRNEEMVKEILLLLNAYIEVCGGNRDTFLWHSLVDVMSRPLCWQPTHITPPFPTDLILELPELYSFSLLSGMHWDQAKASWLRYSPNCQMLLDVILCSLGTALYFHETFNYFLWKLFFKSWLKERSGKPNNHLVMWNSRRQWSYVSENLCSEEQIDEQIVDRHQARSR